jgi:MFS family permease
MTAPSRSSRVFYGWYVLAASSAVLFLSSGGRNTIGIMLKPMADEFGWSRGAISAAAFLNLAVYAAASIVVGRLYDRRGPMWLVAGSTVICAAGFALMATMHSLWEFLLYYGVLNAAGLGGITVPIFGSIIGNWFEKRRGLAVSLALAGSCLGQFFLVPLFSTLVLGSGWRVTCLWIAGATMVLNLPLAFGVLRGDPKAFGLRPYGAGEAGAGAAGARRLGRRGAKTGAEQGARPAGGAPGLTLGEALRTRSLWMFTIIMFVCGGADYLVTTHLVAMATDYGISAATGANMLAWLGLLAMGGVLATGPVVDAVGNKLPIAITFALRAALFVALFAFKEPISFWVFSLGFGLTFVVTALLTPTLVSDLFGVTHLGFISGFITTVHMFGGGLWTYLGGVMFDRTGNYDAALLVSAGMAVVALVFTFFIKDARHTPRAAGVAKVLGTDAGAAAGEHGGTT